MASKQIKMLLVIEDIKTTIRYHFITNSMAAMKKADNNKSQLGYGEVRT